MEWLAITLKWLSQGLIVASGGWALFAETYTINPTTGRRSFNRGGWFESPGNADACYLYVLATVITELRSARLLRGHRECVVFITGHLPFGDVSRLPS